MSQFTETNGRLYIKPEAGVSLEHWWTPWHWGEPPSRGSWVLFKSQFSVGLSQSDNGLPENLIWHLLDVLPEPKMSWFPVAPRHLTCTQAESCKQDSALQINLFSFLLHCTELSLLDYSIFQGTIDYTTACVLFLKQLCLNILVLQFNFPSESTAVIFYQQIHSRMFLLATKTFFHPKWKLGRDTIGPLTCLETFASSSNIQWTKYLPFRWALFLQTVN